MKFLTKTVLILLLTTVVFACKKKDDDDEAVTCDEWFEGDSCEAMINKFIGDYTGGAGFCGTNYEYNVIATPGVVNGISIGQANPGDPPIYYVNAILISSTEFTIPEQDVEALGKTTTISGFGNGDGDTLFYHVDFPEFNQICEHDATKI